MQAGSTESKVLSRLSSTASKFDPPEEMSRRTGFLPRRRTGANGSRTTFRRGSSEKSAVLSLQVPMTPNSWESPHHIPSSDHSCGRRSGVRLLLLHTRRTELLDGLFRTSEEESSSGRGAGLRGRLAVSYVGDASHRIRGATGPLLRSDRPLPCDANGFGVGRACYDLCRLRSRSDSRSAPLESSVP